MKFLAGGLLFCLSLLAAAQEAGKIDFLEGGVRLYDARQKERPAQVGAAINEGDTVETAADGEVHVAMADGGQLAVRPGTQLRIQNYRAEGGKDDRSVFNLVKGALRSITGWIGKYNQKNYEIRTPTATIGVRGTDHETRVIPEGSSEGEAGTYDKVNAGATRMTNRLGSTDINPNQAGFIAAHGRQRPRLLDRVPTFFRPTRNEHRIDNLRDSIHERIERGREHRLREVGERRAGARQRQEFANRPEGHRDWQRRQAGAASGDDLQKRRQELRERRRDQIERQRAAPGPAGDGHRLRDHSFGGPAAAGTEARRDGPLRKRHPAADGDDAAGRPHYHGRR